MHDNSQEHFRTIQLKNKSRLLDKQLVTVVKCQSQFLKMSNAMKMKGLKFLADQEEAQLKSFAVTKGQKAAPKTKKEKKADKRTLMKTKIEARNGIRDDDSTIEASKPLKSNNNKPEADNVENTRRETFTKGWMESFSVKEALPIKQQGKLIRTVQQIREEEDEEEEDINENENEKEVVFKDGFRAVTYPDATDGEGEEEDEGDYEFEPDLEMDKQDEMTSSSMLATQRKEQKKETDPQDKRTPGDKSSERGKKANSVAKFLDSITIYNAKNIIGDICTTITSDPEKSFRKKREISGDTDDKVYNFSDLLSLLGHSNMQIVELAMLSCLLAFKDVLPGYRIRPASDADKDVIFKKETKRLRDYENAILGAYQRYLKFLDGKVAGLKNPKKEISVWDLEAKVGLSALRCQCELLRAVPYFNYRTLLLNSIIVRSSQPEKEITEVCCGTLDHLFKGDMEGEASFEAVRLIGKVIMACKYDVPAGLLRVLSAVKLRVHADAAKGVRRKAKQERRKRKRDVDDVESAMLEANPLPEKSNILRFQADSLHEICLIFFRVIKMKVGFALMPVALEGLGRISHLINIDTVEDLVVLMKTVLTASPSPPALVQLHCIHCAMKTLSGPGSELKMDDEVFVTALRLLIKEIPIVFERWDVALDCLDLSLCKRREGKSSVVAGFVRLLFLHSSHMMADSVGLALLAMANTVLLKYPRVRSELMAIQMASEGSRRIQEEDEVGDLAMRALRGTDSATHEDEEGDGSWLLSLLKVHADTRFARTITALTARDVTTIPMRLVEAKYDLMKVSNRVENVFNAIPASILTNTGKKGGSKNTSVNTIQPNQPKKMSKIQEKNARRKAVKTGHTVQKCSNIKLDEKSIFFQNINEKLSNSKKFVQTTPINLEIHTLQQVKTTS